MNTDDILAGKIANQLFPGGIKEVAGIITEHLEAERAKYREALTQLANAAAILVSHTEDIGKYQGGSGESARELVKLELALIKPLIEV